MMTVTLMSFTPDPDRLVYTSYRQCYSQEPKHALEHNVNPELVTQLIQKHESPLEHVTFTFGISGVSRALTHQLVRHRHQSVSQKSQRYISEIMFDYITPSTIDDKDRLALDYYELMDDIAEFYKKAIAAGVPKEDARYALPNACTSTLISTFNVRSLYNFFTLRTCRRAQWEIRALAKEMLTLCKDVSPLLFQFAGPECKRTECKEGDQSCLTTKT